MIGTVLGKRYKLLNEIGAGGMAWVYQAQDLENDTCVAVKVLYPQYNRDGAYVERFLREAQAVAAINHPNVCVIYDIKEHEYQTDTGSTNRQQFIVMENVEPELIAFIERKHFNPPIQRIKSAGYPGFKPGFNEITGRNGC